MQLPKVIETLSRRLGAGDLPLQTAGDDDLHSTYPKPERYRASAVLVPLVMIDGESHVIMIERSAGLQHHPGQISFPGGRTEEGDADITFTALREAEEEIALPRDAVQVLGMLPLYPTRTGFMITPVVGALQQMPELVLDKNEVAQCFTLPLSYFADPKNRRIDTLQVDGFVHEFHVYDSPYGPVWGATAGILLSLVKALDENA